MRAVQERSRRPLTSPSKVSEELEDFLVAARKAHPTWGPKKLRAWLLHHHPKLAVAGTEHNRQSPATTRTDAAEAPACSSNQGNDAALRRDCGPDATSCVDFKGHFTTGNGRVGYPLTILDAMVHPEVSEASNVGS